MTTSVSLNGTTYTIPRTGDDSWSATGGVDDYLVALATGVLTKAGGTFTLTAEVNTGATYGFKTAYYKSQGTNPGTTGIVRLANAESVVWRNVANSADLALTVNSSNVLQFNGAPIVTLALGSANTALVMNSGGTAYQWATIVNANVDAAAAIAYSKLALTGSIVNADVSGSAAIAYSKLSLTGSVVNADISASAAIAYSKLALTGSIVNADVSGSAAIAYSKLNLATSIVNADISTSAAIAYSKLALTGSIVNADVNASAAIAYSKLSLSGSIVNADINASAAIAYSKLNLASSIATTDLAAGLLVPLTKGGTGQTTANAALNALLPSQTSNSGKVLSTDGSNTSWASAASSTLNQYYTDIGDSTNTRQATNTNLLGDIKAKTASATITMTIATPGVVTWTSHGLSTYDSVYFTTTGALPTGVSASTKYFVTVVDANTFKLSTTLANALAGTFVATSGSQSGTHTGFSGGLIQTPGQTRGVTSGSSVSGGYVGEVITGTAVANSTTSYATAIDATNTVSLTAGVWLLVGTGAGYFNGTPSAATAVGAAVILRNTTDSVDTTTQDYLAQNTATAAAGDSTFFTWSIMTTVNISSAKTYKVQLKTDQVSGSPGTGGLGSRTGGSGLVAVRIA